MTLPDFALRNRYTVWALSIGILAFGLLAYVRLPIQLFPDTAPPLVNVLTAYPGATARDVADLVSDPIEEEAASLQGVYQVSSTSQEGLSLVAVEFDYDISVDLAAVDVQNAISRIRERLPSTVEEPQVLKFSTSDRPVLTVGLVAEDLVAARRLAEDVLAPELQRQQGVALIDVFGGYQPEIGVQVDRELLEAHRLPLGAVVEAIQTYNVSVPAGQIRSHGRQYTFRVDEQTHSVSDLARIPIAARAGGRVLVGDVAQVVEGKGEDLSRYRVDGESAIAIQVFKQDDANTVAVVHRARAQVTEFASRYPDIRFVEAEESASFTQQVVGNMLGSVLQALLLASIVIFLFLGSVRRGLVVAVSMPMSFLLTFAVMRAVGLQLDLVTLTAIILAVGMVVDGSVVVLENISRIYHEEDLPPLEAASRGASEIQFAVIAGNATTLMVLLPLLFLYGFVGKTFGPLAATLLIAFVSSLLVALVLVPVLSALMVRQGGKIEALALKLS
ncbi:MAG: efflux RND transporter permease subunit, partial [Gemmatimonadales bacterium]